jgi:U6 snRNA-associated Sm-like protein LSm7
MSRNHTVGSSPAGRGGGGGGASAAGAKKESILELQKLLDASVRVKCIGGRELEGILRGYDDLVNLVLDDCEEYVRGTVTFSGVSPCPYLCAAPLALTVHH